MLYQNTKFVFFDHLQKTKTYLTQSVVNVCSLLYIEIYTIRKLSRQQSELDSLSRANISNININSPSGLEIYTSFHGTTEQTRPHMVSLVERLQCH